MITGRNVNNLVFASQVCFLWNFLLTSITFDEDQKEKKLFNDVLL